MPDEQANRYDAKEKRTKRRRLPNWRRRRDRNPHQQSAMWRMQRCNELKQLNLLLTVLPELENYKSRINQLEEENKSLQTSL